MENSKCKTCKYCKVFYNGTETKPEFSAPKCFWAWKLCEEIQPEECHYEKK